MEFLLRVLRPLDDFLVWMASPFGVHVVKPGRRYAIMLGVFAATYLVGLLPVPVLPLAALGFAYLGVLAVNRAWVRNEETRSRISKKLEDGDPDAMPDLRWTALVAAVQLFLLFPLAFMQVQRHFCLFIVPENANLWTWFLFSVDSYSQAFLGLLENYGVRFQKVGYASVWAAHLVTLKRVTFDFLLIAAIHRLLAIRGTIREVLSAVKTDPNMAVRLGRRAVEPLLLSLDDADEYVRRGAATGLGKLGDTRAVEPLIRHLHGDGAMEVRCLAAEALGRLRDARAVEPLVKALQDEANVGERDELGFEDGEVGERPRLFVPLHDIAEALGRIGDPRAVEPLLPLLGHPNASVRGAAAEALGRIGDPRAVEPLLPLLQDEEAAVRAAVALALVEFKNPQAVVPLLERLEDEDVNVRTYAVCALGGIGDQRALEPLCKALQQELLAPSGPDYLAGSMISALGNLKNNQAFDLLVLALQREGLRPEAATALGDLGDTRALDPLVSLTRDPNKYTRRNAAAALGKLGDPQAVGPLVPLLGDEDEDVRETAAEAMNKLGSEGVRVVHGKTS